MKVCYSSFHLCHIRFCYIKFQVGYIRFVISDSVISKSVISKGPSPRSCVAGPPQTGSRSAAGWTDREEGALMRTNKSTISVMTHVVRSLGESVCVGAPVSGIWRLRSRESEGGRGQFNAFAPRCHFDYDTNILNALRCDGSTTGQTLNPNFHFEACLHRIIFTISHLWLIS